MSQLPDNYVGILSGLKDRIRNSRMRAAAVVNRELLELYWELGNTILSLQQKEGWGSKVIDRIATDLKSDFPDFKGLSTRNLKYMVSFARLFPHFIVPPPNSLQSADNQGFAIVQAALAQLTWYHIITLMDKVKDDVTREFYIRQTAQNGWSRDVMVHQIESSLHSRVGQLPNNFEQTLPPSDSELVRQVFKDPYKLDFIIGEEVTRERDLENALTSQVTKFLLELGQHFAFMGRQYKMTLGEKEYYFDLLFYHTRLKRYIIIELKIDDFKPEYKGKMEFYLNLADEQLKDEQDGRSIGLILCKTKDGLVAEYALKDATAPIGIAVYNLGERLPDDIKSELPTIQELEEHIEKEIEELKRPVDKKLDRLKSLINDLNMAEVKESKSEDAIVKLYNEVVVPTRSLIREKLNEIISQFSKVEFITYAGGHSSFSDESNIAMIRDRRDCDSFRISCHFKGFKKAGVKAFNISGDIDFKLEQYRYIICPFRYRSDNPIIEKLYHEIPSSEELNNLVERLQENVLDDMMQQLLRIKEVGNE